MQQHRVDGKAHIKYSSSLSIASFPAVTIKLKNYIYIYKEAVMCISLGVYCAYPPSTAEVDVSPIQQEQKV